MRSSFYLLCMLMLSFFARPQNFTWQKTGAFSLHSDDAVWMVDGLDNFYLGEENKLVKYDSTNTYKFGQSSSSFGQVKQLVSINPMKLIYFAEDQQTLCILDNTLSKMDKCVELADLNIDNATLISESVQANKLWVYDNVNSRLLLLALDRSYQPQEITNLKGILDIGQVKQLKERNSRVMVLDPAKGVYLLDLYGSLVKFYPRNDVIAVDANEKALFMLTPKGFEIHPFDGGEHITINLPVNGIREFAYGNHSFYFEADQTVHKFRLHFSD